MGFFTWVTLELMEALGIRSAAFIGHSMGAQIASWIAVTHPDRVTRLMLIGGGLLQPPRPPLLARIFMGIFLLEGWGESRYAELRKDPVKAYESLRPYYADLDTIPLKVSCPFLLPPRSTRLPLCGSLHIIHHPSKMRDQLL